MSNVFDAWEAPRSAAVAPQQRGAARGAPAGGLSGARNPFAGGPGEKPNPFARDAGGGQRGGGGTGGRGVGGPGTMSLKPAVVAPGKAEPPPIFSLEPHPWSERLVGATALVVSNSIMYVALPGCKVLRWRANRDGPPEEMELCRPAKGEAISRLFLDPYGFHLLATLTSGEVKYG